VDGCESRLIARADKNTYDLTAAQSEVTGFIDLARTASITNQAIDEVADTLITDAPAVDSEPLV
jgi:hypothetical protein